MVVSFKTGPEMFKVIIAEDDLAAVELLEEVLIAKGYKVCGVARTVDYAVDLIVRHKPNLAIVDLVLCDGCFGTDIAARLDYRDRPGILYTTGYPDDIRMLTAYGEACLAKPYRAADILGALLIVQQILKTEGGPRQYPGGLSVLAPRRRTAE